MRLRQNTNKKKIIIVSGVAALLIAGTAGALFIPSSPFALNKQQEDRPENTPDYNAPTDDQKKAGEKAKEDFINRQDEADKNNNENSQDGSGTNNNVNITISSANQNGQTYQLRTIIDGLDDGGTCTLTLSKAGSDPVTQEVGTQVLGSYSVCKGFDISTTNLQKGTWQAKIAYKGSLGQGSVSQTVDIQ